MEKYITDLLLILKDLRMIYGRLLLVLRAEQKSIIRLEDKKLSQLIKAKNQLLTMLEVTDNRRRAIFEKIQDEVQKKHFLQITSLTEFADLVEGEFEEPIKKNIKSLKFLARKSRELNQVTEMLIEESLIKIQSFKNHLAALTGTNVYNSSGNMVKKL